MIARILCELFGHAWRYDDLLMDHVSQCRRCKMVKWGA